MKLVRTMLYDYIHCSYEVSTYIPCYTIIYTVVMQLVRTMLYHYIHCSYEVSTYHVIPLYTL